MKAEPELELNQGWELQALLLRASRHTAATASYHLSPAGLSVKVGKSENLSSSAALCLWVSVFDVQMLPP